MLANPGGLKWRAVVALALLAGALTATGAQAQTKSPVERAKRLLESEIGLITRLMHPTATHQSTEVSVSSPSGDGFQIVARYNFKNFIGVEFYSSLCFNFSARGKLEDIEVGERDGIVAPFLAADLGSNILEMVRKDKEVTTLLRRGQVRAGLIQWLNGGF